MLRIKKDRMKDLEKFGFEIKKFEDAVYKHYYYEKNNGINTIHITIEKTINGKTFEDEVGELKVYESDYDMGVDNDNIEDIYDLIKADMVEKVVE